MCLKHCLDQSDRAAKQFVAGSMALLVTEKWASLLMSNKFHKFLDLMHFPFWFSELSDLSCLLCSQQKEIKFQDGDNIVEARKVTEE